ncbi:hypothetical protein FIM49_08000, partial [Helicobacter pylori]
MQTSKHPNIQTSKHSTIQPFNHSSNQAIKQSSNQAIKQSSNQATLPYFYPFYKNPLKNLLLFIIPSFINLFIPPCINPHRIFQPFDSISPIFQSVGLTELNSKEKVMA